MAESLYVNREELQAEVSHIQELASNVQTATDELITKLKECAEGMQTEWAAELRARLQNFNSTTASDAIVEIKYQATKLLNIETEAIAVDQGK